MRRRRLHVAVMLAAGVMTATGPVAVAAPPVQAAATRQAATRPPDQPITRAAIIERAEAWVDARVPYSQTTWYRNGNGSYREDCSGFVSMAWGLPESAVTSTLPGYAVAIGKTALRPGDMLDDTSTHAVLFNAWIDRAKGTFSYIDESAPGIPTSLWTDGNLHARTLAGLPMADYGAYRYDRLVPGVYQVAVHAGTGALGQYPSTRGAPTPPLAEGTSPSVAALPRGGDEVAYVSAAGRLALAGPAPTPSRLPAATTSSSPSIAADYGTGYAVAYRAASGALMILGDTGAAQDTGLTVAASTSPSVTALPRGGYEVAAQAANGHLVLSGRATSRSDGPALAAGTDPSIAASPDGGWAVAYVTPSAGLSLVTSAGDVATGATVAAGTSPTIAALPGGGYEVAFVSATGTLSAWSEAGTVVAPGSDRVAGTPAIAAGLGSTWHVAFDSGDHLAVWAGGSAPSVTQETIEARTSPSEAP